MGKVDQLSISDKMSDWQTSFGEVLVLPWDYSYIEFDIIYIWILNFKDSSDLIFDTET